MTDGPGMFSDPTKVQQRGKGGKIALIAVMVVAALVLVAGATGWWLLTRTEHPTASGQHVEVRLPQGASTEQIARMLSSYGVVRNSLRFQLDAKLSKKALRSGTYELTTGMPDDLVIKALSSPPEVTYVDVLIPEGFTARQVARRFAARAGVSEDEMISLVTSGAPQFAAKHPYLQGAAGDSLEGYLFPATYRIKKGTKPAAIVELMLEKFDVASAGLDLSYAKSKNLTLSDVVIIASILEREAKLPKDYPTIASVIYNRLHARMRLGLDSTIFYVAPEGTTVLGKSDIWNMSPYNTYRHFGLPPGPISNPGIQALTAAAHPATTRYLYYVLTGKDGSQTFTVTYPEFLQAVKKYHAVFGN
ncbi:MAG: endolytic transglycosylase MltG [Coriobacteriia bacterium]|nr:endolytic transglycosylase MltG [Coriobacteriia bacterium]